MPSSKTKSNQSTKSSKKSTKVNKNNILSKLKFKSKKVQFLTVILSFALIGGGFMVYKSFAATPVNLYKQCLPSNCLNARTLGISATRQTDPQKNNMEMYMLTKGGVAYTSTMTLPGNATMKYCVTVKADRNVTVDGGIGFTGRGGGWPVNATTSWTDSCTDNQGPFGGDMPGATISLSNNTNTKVYVSKIFVMTDGAPAPTSTPSK